MSDGLVIRASDPADAVLVFELVRELAAFEKLDAPEFFHLTPQIVARDFYGDRPRIQADLAFWNGEAAGVCLWYRTYASFRAAGGIFLEDIFVRGSHRGRGIGKAFFAHLAGVAAVEGAIRIDWSVLDWNKKAIGFYRGLGALAYDGWSNYRLSGDALMELAAA